MISLSTLATVLLFEVAEKSKEIIISDANTIQI